MKIQFYTLSIALFLLIAVTLCFAFSMPNSPCDPYVEAKTAIEKLLQATDSQDDNFNSLFIMYGDLHLMNPDCEYDKDDIILNYRKKLLEACDSDPALCRMTYYASYEGGEHKEAILMFVEALQEGLIDGDYLNDMIDARKVGMGTMPLRKFRPTTRLFREMAVLQKMKANPAGNSIDKVLSDEEQLMLQEFHLQPAVPEQKLRGGQ
ncbi:MAG: hypothetical protein GVY26_00990 [Bacteroidetes bacterium]|nr:hypothetical protein [Bacteroidota bacterium]